MSISGKSEAETLLEPELEKGTAEEHFPRLENTAEKYGLDGDYDFATEDNLNGGAVAATAKVPGLSFEKVENYEDLKDFGMATVDDEGQIYGVEKDEKIGFIADSEIYPDLDEDTAEHVDLHEIQHLQQYEEDKLWGDALKHEYNLSDEMTFQLNYIDQLMDVAEDPLLGNLVDDAKVTALVEGYTQRVTEAMQDNGKEIGENFYPGYTELADHMMKEVYGTDPEKEFDPESEPVEHSEIN